MIKDSGTRRDFESGAVRDAETGKGRFDLIPPVALELLAKHFEEGALKYEDRNWEKGMPLGQFLDSALRHINKYRDGQRDEPHIVAAFWNLAAFLHTREMIVRGILPPDLDDVPAYVKSQPVGIPEWMGKLDNELRILNDENKKKMAEYIFGSKKCDKVECGYIGLCPECSNMNDYSTALGLQQLNDTAEKKLRKLFSRKYTAYFSHHIRGLKGDDATDQDMIENREDAIKVCNQVRELLPDWEIYCPAEVDEVVSELFKSKAIGEKEILAADCKIIDRRDALFAYCKDNHISRGMQIELDHAQKVKIPSITFSVLHDADLLDFAKDVQTYG